MEDNYDDIIQLTHHVSSVHPHMSIHDRAAQFAPFAALTGHGAAIAERRLQGSPMRSWSWMRVRKWFLIRNC